MSWRSVVASGVLLGAVATCSPAATGASPLPSPSASTLASATSSPTSSATASPRPSPTAAPNTAVVTYDSPVLGYRITLPAIYRRLSSALVNDPSMLGRDIYTRLTAEEERAECLSDVGDIPPPSTAALLFVEAYRNTAGLSAKDWVNAPLTPGGFVFSHFRRVEQLTIGGHEAVRLVADNPTADVEAFVIRDGDRMYVITPTMWGSPPAHPLDAIAAGFATIARQPFPPPTPTPAPAVRRQAANDLAQALVRAFAAKDADAVGRLMPACHIGVSPLIDDQPLANSGGGGLNRSVPSFIQALRELFANGALTVTIDPNLDVRAFGGPEQYVVRSSWREPDRTTTIDLTLDIRDSGWQWIGAVHHYKRAELINGNCIPYRSPWVPTPSSC